VHGASIGGGGGGGGAGEAVCAALAAHGLAPAEWLPTLRHMPAPTLTELLAALEPVVQQQREREWREQSQQGRRESSLCAHWVAVPKRLRARRVHRR
jgi:hypothetical protein